ncbi:MAG: ABC transporter permease [Candidatus Sericytochromatia bacterium]|nr:ABC transporter permease [Candidatus Sericytochromatia bacterium]
MMNNILVDFVAETGRFSGFIGQTFYWAFRPPFFLKETIRSMKNVAFQCFLPVIAVVGPTGMVVTLQGMTVFKLFGAERLLSSLLAESMFRELSPMLASIMVAAQAGSAVAGELGTMRVTEEIDAMEVMSINPFQYVIIPRLIALALICPLLNVIACLFGITGGFLVAVILKHLNQGVFIDNLFSYLKLSHIWGGMLKASIFGLVVGIMSCYKGYKVTGGALGVGKAANNTVVHSILLIVIINYFVTSALINLFE